MKEEHRQLIELVHGSPDPPEPQAEGPPNFDGGARETAPLPTDPVTDHDQFLVELLQQLPLRGSGGGGEL